MTERTEWGAAPVKSTDLNRLDAQEYDSPIGSAWYTVRCAEHIFHTLCPLDRRRSECVPGLLSRQMRENMGARALNACQLLPRDTVMELLAYTVSAFRSIFRNPRTTLQKTTELCSPSRLNAMTPCTMRWLVRQPGRTYAAKVANKPHIPAEKKVFSADTKENRFALHLYRKLAKLAEGRYVRIREQIWDGQETWKELTILQEFLALRAQLRVSPLRDVPAQPCVQANNVLISDKEYSIVWRAGGMLEQYEKELPRTLENIQEQVMSAIYTRLLETFFARERVCLLDWFNTTCKVDGILRLCDSNGRICRSADFLELDSGGRASQWIQVEYDRTHIRTKAVCLSLNRSDMRYHAGRAVERTYTIELEEGDGYEGVSMLFTDQQGEVWNRYGNLSEIQTICETVCKDVLRSDDKRTVDRPEKPGELCLELSLEQFYYSGPGQCLRSIPAGVSREDGQVCAVDPSGFYLNGEQPVAARSVFDGGMKGARNFREVAGSLRSPSRAIYMMPDTLSEFEQGPVRLAVQGSFPRNYPVWRSIGAALFCAGPGMKEGLRPKTGEWLAVVDLQGEGSVTRLQYIWDDAGYPVFRRLPPRPLEKAENACQPAFCRNYLQAYQEKYGWKLPEETARALLAGGTVSHLLLCRKETVVPVRGADGLEWFHLEFDGELQEELARAAVETLRQAGCLRKEESGAKIVLLADHLRVAPAQIQEVMKLPKWPLLVRQKQIMAGALRVGSRLNQGLITWEERLPDLSLEIADGYYKLFPLVRSQQMQAGAGCQKMEDSARFQLPAGVREIRFPLVMKDAETVSNVSAYLRGQWLPLPEPETVSVSVHYDFSGENCYKLYFSPVGQGGRMPQSVLAEYVPDEYKLLPDDALSFQKRKWQPRVTATEAAKEFTKKTGQLIFWLEQILAQHNQNAVKTLRYMAGRPDIADCHLTWLYAVNYYRNDSAVHTAFRQFMDGRLPEILYDLVTQEKAIVTDRNFYQRFSDESTEPKQGSAAIVLRRYAIRFLAALDNRLISEFNFQWGEEIKLYLLYRLPETFPEGFVLSAVYRDMLRSQEDDIRVLQQVVTLGMDRRFQRNIERMLSALVWQSQGMISQIYSVSPQFIRSSLESCLRELSHANWLLEERRGGELNLVRLRDYCELLLAILRLRCHDGFELLKTESREAVRLARRIRRVDALLAEQFGGGLDDRMKPRVGIQAEQPAHLRDMSKIAFILNTCLTGENGASAITLTGFDDVDG